MTRSSTAYHPDWLLQVDVPLVHSLPNCCELRCVKTAIIRFAICTLCDRIIISLSNVIAADSCRNEDYIAYSKATTTANIAVCVTNLNQVKLSKKLETNLFSIAYLIDYILSGSLRPKTQLAQPCLR